MINKKAVEIKKEEVVKQIKLKNEEI